MDKENLYLYAAEDADPRAAQELAAHLQIPLKTEPSQADLWLQLDKEGLMLTDGSRQLKGDFAQNLPRLKQGKVQGEMLVKAAKIKGGSDPLTAIDATAGMGEDSLLLAAAGFHMILFEVDPIIAALLRDTLQRAQEDPRLAPIVARMELREADSVKELPGLYKKADVVLLDPMFPARQKSALVKKKFQLLQQLERPCSEERELLDAALAAHPRKIVIKRPIKGPYLAERKPDYTISGKAIRYDCLVLPPVAEAP